MGEESLAALLGATAKRTSAGAEFLETLVDLAEEGHDTSLLAAAHLACAVVDGRHLLQAARRYLDADNLVGLQQVLEIALRRGQIRVVAELRRTGIAELAVPDYAAWLRTKGLPYFDLYRDHDASLSFICDADADNLCGGQSILEIEPGEPCGDCGEFQTLVWRNVQWPKDRPTEAVYVCQHCGSAWSDAARYRAISRGEWRAEAESEGIAGFYLNGL